MLKKDSAGLQLLRDSVSTILKTHMGASSAPLSNRSENKVQSTWSVRAFSLCAAGNQGALQINWAHCSFKGE